MKSLKVNIPNHSYSIYIAKWDLKHTLKILKNIVTDNKLFIITNNKIKNLYQKNIESFFSKELKIIWLSIPDGEQYKNLKTCESLLTKLSHNQAHRNSTLMALGGGVIGDITGFVAATYMRGIQYVQMPTTLLAQVDSSVGGKTGVDLKTGKNLVGAFYQPKAVFIHTDFLKSLPMRELQCGLAEVIKYGVIWDANLFSYLEKNAKKITNLNSKSIEFIIFKSCAIKAQVVKKDEKESSLRAILNFGHTLGHAIEALYHFKKIKHGEAVAMGMVFAAKLSFNLKHSPVDETPKIEGLLKKFDLKTTMPKFTKTQYQDAILRDKKTQGKIIKFILLKKIGKVNIVPLFIKEIKQCL